MFGLLAERGFASKDQIFAALYAARIEADMPEIKIVDVFICKLRRKLRTAGLTIETRWGQGYELSGDNRARARALLGISERKAA